MRILAILALFGALFLGIVLPTTSALATACPECCDRCTDIAGPVCGRPAVCHGLRAEPADPPAGPIPPMPARPRVVVSSDPTPPFFGRAPDPWPPRGA